MLGTSPILIPAYPALLRAGLPVVDSEGRRFVVIDTWAANPEDRVLIGRRVSGTPTTISLPESWLWVDVCDPGVRDFVCRGLWHTLRPEDTEPLTAPTFVHQSRERLADVLVDSWWVGRPGSPAPVYFSASGKSGGPFDQRLVVAVPDLARIVTVTLDRDLLALAAVAKIVLGSS